MICTVERERRGRNDIRYHNLTSSKQIPNLCLYATKYLSKIKSYLSILIKNIKNNLSQKLLLFFITHEIFPNAKFILYNTFYQHTK